MTSTIEQLLTRYGLLAGALTALLMLIPKVREVVITPARGAWKQWRTRRHRIDRLIELIAPNGGSSLHDKVAGISTAVSAIAVRLEDVAQLQLAAIDLQPEAVLRTDPEGHCIFANRAWQALTGIPATDATGTGWLQAIHPDDQPRVRLEIMAAMREGRGYVIEYRLINRSSGAVRRVRSTGRPVGAVAPFGFLRIITPLDD